MGKQTFTDAPVKKNDIVEIETDGMGYEGEGIAHIGGFTVFIPFALPGEKVRARIIAVKRTFAVGKLQAVLTPSVDRVQPFCSAFGKCGGCTLQHVSYAAQLRLKKEIVLNAFKKIAKTQVCPDDVVPSPQIRNYRNKMSLPVRGNPPQIGFFAAGTHRVVSIEECPVQFEDNGPLIRAFYSFMHRNGIEGYNETTGKGTVRHLAVRKTGDGITVTVVANGAYKKQLLPFNEQLQKLYGNKYAYYINYNVQDGNRILGEQSEQIGGNAQIFTEDGLRICVHPHSFFQVNDGVRKILYREVVRAAAGEDVIDAYSGAGLLSALLAQKARSVTAIEIEKEAVASARDLLQRNKIENVRLVCGDCATELSSVTQRYTQENRLPAVVLDPPRAGCDTRVLQAVSEVACPKVAYVSCNPATLARDAAFLLRNGYRIIRLTPFDMFPHSGNVETLAVFEKSVS